MNAAVVEIGRALREARQQLGLDLSDVEAATHIRAPYLAALEREEFERLPERAYAKSFLREYAEFVGLDPRPLVDAFETRYPDSEPLEVVAPSLVERPRRRALPALSALVVVVAAAAGLLVWQLNGSAQKKASTKPPTVTRPETVTSTQTRTTPPPAASSRALLVLRARGPCWLSIRSGSANGAVLFEKTLPDGGVLRYALAPSRPRLWIRVGAPWNLELLLNGKAVGALPTVPANLLVGANGVRSA